MKSLKTLMLLSSVALTIQSAGTAIAQFAAAGEDYAAPLFDAAVQRYHEAGAQSPANADATLLEVRRLFDVITHEFPRSGHAADILRGGNPGGVDLTKLPDDPKWYQTIVPGGSMSGYKHGQFPSEGQQTHPGWDIGDGRTCSQPIIAPAAGTVVREISSETTDEDLAKLSISREEQRRDFEDSLGNTIVLRHGGGTEPTVYTIYLHMSAPPADESGKRWKPGDEVKAGQQLGIVGQTSKAAKGCHVHFEARRFLGARAIYHSGIGRLYPPFDAANWAPFKSDWIEPAAWLRASFLRRYLDTSSSPSGAGTGSEPASLPDPPEPAATDPDGPDAWGPGIVAKPQPPDWI